VKLCTAWYSFQFIEDGDRCPLTDSHWHLGPLAVDSHLQGLGIGGAMLAAFCERMDDLRALSYLETDKSENVRFYQRFGFTVIAEAEVVGVRCWFMSFRHHSGPSVRWHSLTVGRTAPPKIDGGKQEVSPGVSF